MSQLDELEFLLAEHYIEDEDGEDEYAASNVDWDMEDPAERAERHAALDEDEDGGPADDDSCLAKVVLAKRKGTSVPTFFPSTG